MADYFVFVQGMRGPEGQILRGEVPLTGSGKSVVKYLFGPLKLEGENTTLSLDDLILKYQDKIVSHE